MHMTFTVAVAGASGYAGGEMLRVLLAHPEARIGTLTAHSNAGTPLGRPPAAPALAGRPRPRSPRASTRLAGHDVVVLALPHGASGAIAAELAARGDARRRRRPRRGPPARRRGRLGGVLRQRARGHLALRPARAAAPGGARRRRSARRCSPDARRIAVPGCNVTAVSLGPAAGRRRRPDRADGPRRGAGQRLLGRGQVAQDAPAGRRGAGQRAAVRGGRHAPAHPRDRAEPAVGRARRT